MNEHERDEGERGFKVQDRRRFSATGEPRPAEGAAATPETAAAASAAAEAEADAAAAARGRTALPDINFTTFTMSLSTQALVHLGEVEDPFTKTAATDLDAAKQLIDILGMLREKTRGNLDENEERLLDAILYDLRLRYVERAKRAPSA
jgi:hypothetical protein